METKGALSWREMYAWEKIKPMQEKLLQASSDNTMIYEECEEHKNKKTSKTKIKKEKSWWVKSWREEYFLSFWTK